MIISKCKHYANSLKKTTESRIYPILKKDKNTVIFINLQKFYIESDFKK